MNNHFFEQKDCGLQAFWSSTPQFKTARVSAHLVLPLTTPENAALYALVPNMISRATREYPDYTQFGKRLAELYGASVQPGVTRVGDNQILTLAAAGIANPYAFDGEDVQQALSEMLESILFTPLCDENGLFQVSGEDINSPRQSFVIKAMENPMFSNLIDATWKLIGHEKTGSAIC